MNYLFIHQSMPSQFLHLAPALAREPGNRVIFLTRSAGRAMPGVETITYSPTRSARAATHHYVRLFENSVLHGQQVLRECLRLRNEGFVPDLIIAHPGWGEALFLKDVFPRSKLLNYCEFYYHGTGADVGFSADQPAGIDAICRARARNAHLLLSLQSCDHGISPTHWQKAVHPREFHRKISVIFDGIDTATIKPDPTDRFTLPDGRVLTAADTVVTYIARNLEPYRGFPPFMRAVPGILAANPAAHVVIVGGDEISYGREAASGGTWRQAMLDEVGPLDPARVTLLGRIPYRAYLALLRVSTAHVYLTVPFVLSWSCMEALSAGCLVIGSRTAPVQEVIRDGENGLLTPFDDPAALTARVSEAIERRVEFTKLRDAARRTVEARYALPDCLKAQRALVSQLLQA